MIPERFALLAKISWYEYRNEYGDIPKIQEIVEDSKDAYIQILRKDLRDGKYILHVDPEMFEFSDEHIKGTLFHEYTHIKDYLDIPIRDEDKLTNLMASYSEAHGTEVYLCKMMSYVENNLCLDNHIVYKDGYITIRSLLEQTFEKVKHDFELMSNNKGKDIYFDLRTFYYYLGYINALKQYNINYEFQYHQIPSKFFLECKKNL